MAFGFEVCIHRDGRWEVYSFFDNDQEHDAVYQAKDIKNNYNAVCVLAPENMQVLYFHSKNKERQPKYLDIRSDLKLAKKSTEKKPKPVKSVHQPQQSPQPQPEIQQKEDPNFTKDDQRKAFLLSFMVVVIGTVAAIFAPEMIFSEASDPILKVILFIIIFAIGGLMAVFTYQLSEHSTRMKRESTNFDNDEPWRRLGLSDSTVKKLKKTQAPEVKNAISQAIPKAVEATPETELHIAPAFTPTAVDRPNFYDVQNTIPSSPENKTEEQEQTTKPKNANELPHASVPEPIQNTAYNNLHTNAPAHTAIHKELLEVSADESENQLAEKSLENLLKEVSITIGKTSYNNTEKEFIENEILPATLYLCGCASYMVRHLNLPQKQVKETVPLALTRLDVDPSLTESYIAQLAQYIHLPRHAVMFDTGVTDTKTKLTDETATFTYATALKKWKEQQNDPEKKSFFAAVLFTDIENFTEQTRTQGEQWMIDVLHAHNDITRRILQSLDGHEIKHTGDGILAMFGNINRAVEAATLIQRAFEIFCQNMPQRTFKVRMGISAGDIVTIEGDIFGETVNLAARVMSKGIGGDIMVSASIKGVCEGTKHQFIDIGKQKLKGFNDQNIYKVKWQLEETPETDKKNENEPQNEKEKEDEQASHEHSSD